MPDYESTQLHILDEIGDVSVDELYHHGIKGMKWGVRRFQKKDGSLTVLGRARQKMQEASDRRKADKAAEAESERVRALMSKPIRKLTDAEFKERMERSNREKQLLETEARITQLSKEPETVMKRLMSTAMSDIVKPAVINAGKNALQNYLNARLGMTVQSMLKDLKDAAGNNKASNQKNNKQNKPKTDNNTSNSTNKPKSSESTATNNPVNKPQKSTKETVVNADYKDVGSHKPTSNSNATSVSNLYKSGYRMSSISDKVKNTQSASISDLSNSGYRMRSLEGKSALDNLISSGWTMRSLEDME